MGFVVEACINALLDPASASVNIFIDDDGRILEFTQIVFDEILGSVISCYASCHLGINLKIVKLSLRISLKK